MSLLDNNLDISVKDIIENACLQWVRNCTLGTNEFIFEWGYTDPNNVINHPERYCIGTMNDMGKCYVTICNIKSYYTFYCKDKKSTLSKVLKYEPVRLC